MPLLTITAWLALGAPASARAAPAAPSYLITTGQMQEVLAQRFPMRYQVPGLFDLDVAQPRLRLGTARGHCPSTGHLQFLLLTTMSSVTGFALK